MWLFDPYPSFCQGNLASEVSSNSQTDIPGNLTAGFRPSDFALKGRCEAAEMTHMFFRITSLSFQEQQAAAGITPGAARHWDGQASPGEIGRPGDLPVPVGQQLRRWGALLALAGLALPAASAARAAHGRPPEVAVVDAGAVQAPPATSAGTGPGVAPPGGLPTGDIGVDTAPAQVAPWEAGVVEPDGKPLPTAPPPGPVPVDGIPQVAGAPGTTAPARNTPAPGETARSADNRSASSAASDLVPADREYLRPILIRYAQENGLPADLVMSLAWVESSWRRSAVSDQGAVGVMQLMPRTVHYVSTELLHQQSDLDPRNATSNIRMGTRYLRTLVDRYKGNVRQALIAYNQGLTRLDTSGSLPSSDAYADRVIALRPQFRSA